MGEYKIEAIELHQHQQFLRGKANDALSAQTMHNRKCWYFLSLELGSVIFLALLYH